MKAEDVMAEGETAGEEARELFSAPRFIFVIRNILAFLRAGDTDAAELIAETALEEQGE